MTRAQAVRLSTSGPTPVSSTIARSIPVFTPGASASGSLQHVTAVVGIGAGKNSFGAAQVRMTMRDGCHDQRTALAQEVGIAVGGHLAPAREREADDRVARILKEAEVGSQVGPDRHRRAKAGSGRAGRAEPHLDGIAAQDVAAQDAAGLAGDGRVGAGRLTDRLQRQAQHADAAKLAAHRRASMRNRRWPPARPAGRSRPSPSRAFPPAAVRRATSRTRRCRRASGRAAIERVR